MSKVFYLFAVMKWNRQIRASIFLVLFSITQLADLHALSHEDATDEDCAICLLATVEQQEKCFILTKECEVPVRIEIPPHKRITLQYTNLYYNSSINYLFQNKAPPTKAYS